MPSIDGGKFRELFMDSRVQLFLGKFLGGELNTLSPVLDLKMGYRYPEAEIFVDELKEVEPFLRMLQDQGLMTSEVCGFLVCCAKCGSSSVDRGLPLVEGGAWSCRNCGATVNEGKAAFRPLFCYSFSKEGIAQMSEMLIVKPLRDFLHERGYGTESPGTLVGESGVTHTFDIIARGVPNGEPLVVDFVVSDRPIGKFKVVSMFAKVYDTNPFRSILVAFPGLMGNAKKLADQYRIELVETSDISKMWKELRKVIPPVDEFRFEALDVMTLLSLPDHLRKTATVASKLGRVTADDIAGTTNRARAVESGYLNQLVRMGYLKKERRGREVLFSVLG